MTVVGANRLTALTFGRMRARSDKTLVSDPVATAVITAARETDDSSLRALLVQRIQLWLDNRSLRLENCTLEAVLGGAPFSVVSRWVVASRPLLGPPAKGATLQELTESMKQAGRASLRAQRPALASLLPSEAEAPLEVASLQRQLLQNLPDHASEENCRLLLSRFESTHSAQFADLVIAHYGPDRALAELVARPNHASLARNLAPLREQVVEGEFRPRSEQVARLGEWMVREAADLNFISDQAFDAAVQFLDAVVEHSPASLPSDLRQRLQTALVEHSRPEQAAFCIRHNEPLLRLLTGTPELVQRLRGWESRTLGRVLLLSSDISPQEFERVAARCPDTGLVNFFRQRLELRLEVRRAAESTPRQALDLALQRPVLLNRLLAERDPGEIPNLCEHARSGQLDEFLDDFSQAARQDRLGERLEEVEEALAILCSDGALCRASEARELDRRATPERPLRQLATVYQRLWREYRYELKDSERVEAATQFGQDFETQLPLFALLARQAGSSSRAIALLGPALACPDRAQIEDVLERLTPLAPAEFPGACQEALQRLAEGATVEEAVMGGLRRQLLGQPAARGGIGLSGGLLHVGGVRLPVRAARSS